MPITPLKSLGSLDQLSDGSRITTRIDKDTKKSALVVIEGGFSSFMDSVRAYFYPETTRRENQDAITQIQNKLSSLYGSTAAESFSKKFSQTGSHVSSAATPPLDVKSLKTVLLDIKQKNIEKRLPVLDQRLDAPKASTVGKRAMASSMNSSSPAKPVPTQEQMGAYSELHSKITDFKKTSTLFRRGNHFGPDSLNRFDLEVQKFFSETSSITGADLDTFFARCENIAACPDKSLAKVLYDHQFKKEDGTYRTPTSEELTSYNDAAQQIMDLKTNNPRVDSFLLNSQVTKFLSKNPSLSPDRIVQSVKAYANRVDHGVPKLSPLQERLRDVSSRKDVSGALTLLADISALPSVKEQTTLRTDLLKNFGIFEKDNPDVFKLTCSFGYTLLYMKEHNSGSPLQSEKLEAMKLRLETTLKSTEQILISDTDRANQVHAFGSSLKQSIDQAQAKNQPIPRVANKDLLKIPVLSQDARGMLQSIADSSAQMLRSLENPRPLANPIIDTDIAEV